MKKLLLLVLLLGGYAAVQAQTPSEAITRLFDKYDGAEGVTTVNVSGDLFKMIAATDKNNEGGMSDLASQITQMRILVKEQEAVPGSTAKSLLAELPRFESLLSVKDEDTKVEIMVRSAGNLISHLILIADSEDELVVMEILGSIKLDQLSQVIEQASSQASSAASMKSMEDAVDWQIRPNPASAASEIFLDIPEEMVGGEVFIFNLNGAKLTSMKLKKQQVIIPANSLKPGVYLVNLEKEGVQYGKRLIVN